MPTLQAPGPPSRTGIRLIDDLIGAAPDPATPRPPTNALREASAYETYVQPAVLGLRRAAQAATHAIGLDDPNTQVAMMMNPLAMVAEAPAAKAASSIAAPAAEAAMGGLRRAATGGAEAIGGLLHEAGPSVAKILRQNRNAAALARYSQEFDPVTMEAIQAFADRNPRVFSRMRLTTEAPRPDARGTFAFSGEPTGARIGEVRLGAPQPGDTPERLLQVIEHEAVHGMQAKRLGPQAFAEQAAAEQATPYFERPLEQQALRVQRGRAATRRMEDAAGRRLSGRERADLLRVVER